MTVVSSSPFSDLAGSLPYTDEERLLFYAELVVANTSQLLADLTSPKYTFLSFSEKSRNEVRQKTSLLHSINQTFNNLVKAYNEVNNMEKEHSQLQSETVKYIEECNSTQTTIEDTNKYESVNDKIIDLEISPSNTTENEVNVNDKVHHNELEVCEEKNEDSTNNIDHNVSVKGYNCIENECNSQCAVELHDAKVMLAEEESALQDVSKEISNLDSEIDKYRSECDAMSLYVQQLKHHIDEAQSIFYNAQIEWHVNVLLEEELEERQVITNECEETIQGALREHLEKYLEITEVHLTKVRSSITDTRNELQERRRRRELELATYQIAYKEEQANVQRLKDEIITLRQRQHTLEYIAKEQQIAESKANSLTRALRYALSPSQSTQTIPVPLCNAEANSSCAHKLSTQMEIEIERDHLEVNALAARVNAMEWQRHQVAGVLIQSKSLLEHYMTDFTTIKGVVERIQAILAPGIHLDSVALSE